MLAEGGQTAPTATAVRIGAESDGSNPNLGCSFAGGALGPSMTGDVRTAAQVKNIYRRTAPYLGLIV